MQVHSLWIYPVKSLAGIAVDEFELDDFGPVSDRRWMIIDDAGKFVTQRTVPELARIGVALEQGSVELAIPGEGRFTLTPTDDRVETSVWNDGVMAQLAQSKVSDALSRFCGRPLRLAFMPSSSFRRVDPTRVAQERRVSFADGFPLLVTNLASLDDLNRRLEHPVEMRRFRPNVVVEGTEAWAEDHWRTLRLDACRLTLAKPCSRCVLTTVDPQTGVKDPGTQPLRTLSGFRRTEEGVIFGMNAIHDSMGRIRIGDAVIASNTE